MSNWTRVCCALILLFAFPAHSGAKDAEDVFAEANTYTVRIDVSISIAFAEDNKGAWHGAGFLVDRERRWVMTNAHVAGHSPSSLEVLTHDGSRVGARKVYVDPYIDVAIIELDEEVSSLKEASLGCTQDPGTGHPVGAYGHPWGLNFTGTQGVISGSTEKWGPTNLQTDTPINGGNSGGPLISMKTGRVIGINTSRINDENDQNTNFAVPIGQTCRILSLLRDGIDPSPPQKAFDFYDTIEENDELIVARSFLSSQDIQLQEGDEIIAVGNQPVSNESELFHWLRGTLDDVHLKVRRDNELIELNGQITPEANIVDRQGVFISGVLFANAPFQDKNALATGIDIMVHDIERGSEGHSADIQNYDFVVRVDGTPVQNLEHLRQLLMSGSQSSGDVQMDFLRLSGDWQSGRLFESVRRDLNWTPPEVIGVWPSETTAAKQND
jgi:S1-C subfamily serine protease